LPATTRAPDELAAWLRLTETPGIGATTARQLLAAFGLPDQIFAQPFASLARLLPEKTVRALLSPPSDALRALVERTAAWADEPGNAVLTLADSAYPQTLLHLPDPPAMLYVKGRLDLLDAPALGIVGARNATVQGAQNAQAFAEAVSHAGLTVVSGLALGIDAAAHHGGLKGRGSTVAVIGTGADIVYPARNRELAHRIAGQGTLLSEFPLGSPAKTDHFPRRNRLIAGLSRGVLVVEAATQSGSLITARLAGEQGREVFAIPGSIHSPLSRGCHQLIRQGAKLVESAQDILEELRWDAPGAPKVAPTAPATSATPAADDPLLAALGHDPASLDALCARTGASADALSAQLLTLELDGLVERLPGNLFRRLTP
jgi:DNA processing protein